MDVTGRAEVIRNLGKTGTWDDLAALIDTGLSEKSPSVRLLAGVAANAILVRQRGELTDSQRDKLVTWVGRLDPGINPALMLALAPAEARALDRVGRMLRDGRTEVRTGATAVVRRMLLSRWCREPAAISATIASWLGGRLASDAAVDLIRLVGEAGLVELRPVVARVPSTGGSHGDLLAECYGRLDRVASPTGWDGWWVSDGRDVQEEADEQTDVTSSLWIDSAKVSGRADRAGLRLVFAQQAGAAERTPAILGDHQARWLLTGPGLLKAAEGAAEDLRPDLADALAGALAGQEGPAARVRTLCQVMAGHAADALEALENLAQDRRAKPESFLWLARAHAQAGNASDAARAARTFLDRAPKKALGRAEAEEIANRGDGQAPNGVK